MFSKKEIKEFLIKYGKKWFFPDFTNKLTWFVITLGGSLVLVPQELKVTITNWLIATFNINSDMGITLPEVEKNNDNITGVLLIFFALLHNLGYKYYDFLKEKLDNKRQTEKSILSRDADVKLYNDLRDVLSYDTIRFLEEHIWSVKFNHRKLEPLEIFLRHFKNAEYEFNSEVIEDKKIELYKAIQEFSSVGDEVFFSAGHDEKNDIYYISVEHEWKFKNEKLYYSTQNKLTNLSNNIVVKYNELIKSCKKELGV